MQYCLCSIERLSIEAKYDVTINTEILDKVFFFFFSFFLVLLEFKIETEGDRAAQQMCSKGELMVSVGVCNGKFDIRREVSNPAGR